MRMQSSGIMAMAFHRAAFLTRSRRGVTLLGGIMLLLAAATGIVGFVASSHAQARIALANANTAATTYKGDNARDGQYPNETTLTTSNVNSTQFGRRVSYPVDGQVYAQPLFVPNVTISGGTHNVVFVATEHDSVYAFDADATSAGAPLWQRSFLGTNVTTIPAVDVYGKYPNHDIDPEIGVTGTPVIDAGAGTLYVVAATKENGTTYMQRLHALDITSGNERSGSPVAITASVPGTGDASSGGKISFAADKNNQRDALTLQNGVVYIAWSSYGDTDPYHGWVIGYNAGTLAQTAAFADTANGSEGGIWMGAGGGAADSSGALYFVTGNGTFDLNTGGVDGGDTIYKMNAALQTQSTFTPFNQSCLSSADSDLGSGGVLILPHVAGAAHPDTALEGGKEGRLYLLDRSNLGGFTATSNPCSNQNLTNVDKVVQELPPGTTGGIFGTPATWSNGTTQYVYIGGVSDHIKAFTFNGLLSTAPVSQSSESYGFTGGNPVISSNGTTAGTGIVWAIETGSPGVLHAYDATNLGTELYNSGQNAGRDALGGYTKFSVPTVGNGRVFVGTGAFNNNVDSGTLDIFGLLPTGGAVSTGYAVNSGGSAAGNFAADNFVSGGTVATPITNAISTTGVVNPAPQAVYQTERFGNFTYTFPNLVPGATYKIRLHLSENYWTAAGKRSFNLSINGSQVLTNFDIFAAAGGQYIAIVKEFRTTADSGGKVTMQFTTVTDNAKADGIEVIPDGLAVNSGGGAAGAFIADNYVSGGTVATPVTNTIGTTGVTNPAPQAVYQTERYANFTYTLPGFKPGSPYQIRLHFSENYWTAAGQRSFNVTINGTQVLTNFDIFAAAGGQYKAIVKEFTTTASSSGTITIQYVDVIDHAKSDGIEVIPIDYAVNSGGGAAGYFAADGFVSGTSQTATATAAVDTSQVPSPAPQAVYLTERYGNFTYAFPGLNPGGSYTVRLHFSENYWTANGQRVFNVSINGGAVLSNFDIFAAAGGANKAIVRVFTATADSSGTITIQYTTMTDHAKSDGIEISGQ